MQLLRRSLLFMLACLVCMPLQPYPIDGFNVTHIRRLLRLELIQEGRLAGTKLLPGQTKSREAIQLNLTGSRSDSLEQLPAPDPELQKAVSRLLPSLHDSYALALMDITPGRPLRYAQWKEQKGFQPGSVGKLAVVAGLFAELERLYPDSFAARLDLLCTTQVRAGSWAIPNEHTVPFYDPESQRFFKRTLQENDVFSLFEWADHMLSVSSNGAASVVWREVILMRAFGVNYPVSEARADSFFRNTPRDTLSQLTIAVVNEPLRDLGITEEEWRLGSLFTRGGKTLAPGQGGSIGTPAGLMKFLVALERGKVVDEASSLEIKRLMYMTDRRIRYAASPALNEAAVYFKSGSLYKCKPEEGYECGKYRGNVDNYMNSVAIVEQPNGAVYLVVLMTNVLRKNSASDHMSLAGSIHRLMQSG